MCMFQKLKDHFIPHKGNSHSPKLLEAEGVATLLLVIMLLQVTFVAHTAMVKNSSFLAAVLPTVLVTMTNVDRAEAGIIQLQSDALLARAAQAKANDMATRGYFAHRDPGGRDPWYWFDKVGYVYSYAGENLAIDFNESADVEKAWMNSPAHKANIMKGNFTKVGIGVSHGIYEGRETTFVVQFFAKPAVTPIVAIVPTKPVVQPEVFIATEEAVQVGDGQVLGESFIPIITNTEQDGSTVLLVDESGVLQDLQKSDTQGVAHVKTMQERFIGLASSPKQWYMPVLVALFALFAVVFALAFHAHVTRREVESIALALSVLIILAGLVYFNFGGESTSALVPSDGQSASVSIVFEDGFYYQQ